MAMFKRKEGFMPANAKVEFDNRPGGVVTFFIRLVHGASLAMIRAGGFNACNPLVVFLSYCLYFVDGTWSGLDKQYFVKRRALYGHTFATVMAINISRYDEHASAPDSLDARLLSIPQRRGFYLGATLLNPWHVPVSADGERSVSILICRALVSPTRRSRPTRTRTTTTATRCSQTFSEATRSAGRRTRSLQSCCGRRAASWRTSGARRRQRPRCRPS
jgi:hypothetical protein